MKIQLNVVLLTLTRLLQLGEMVEQASNILLLEQFQLWSATWEILTLLDDRPSHPGIIISLSREFSKFRMSDFAFFSTECFLPMIPPFGYLRPVVCEFQTHLGHIDYHQTDWRKRNVLAKVFPRMIVESQLIVKRFGDATINFSLLQRIDTISNYFQVTCQFTISNYFHSVAMPVLKPKLYPDFRIDMGYFTNFAAPGI